MIRPTPLTDESYNHSDKILLYGDSNSGKTYLLSTIGGKGLIVDQEKGLKTLRTIKNRKLYKNVKNIDGVQTFTPDEVMDVLNWLKGTRQKYDWIAIDSISDLAFKFLEENARNTKDNRKAYLETEFEMNRILRTMRDMKGYKSLVLAGMKRIEDEDTKRTIYRPSMPSQNMSRSLEYWYDEVLCAICRKEFAGKEVKYRYFIQCNATPDIFAKDRSNVLDLYEEPNLKTIFKKVT